MSERGLHEDEPSYSFRPRPFGAEYAFRLGREAVDWRIGLRSGQIAYPMIERVRLRFRPGSFMGDAFVAHILSRQGIPLMIASTSARSMIGHSDQGPEFRAFISALHGRLAEKGSGCRFEAGFPAWRWWPGVVISAALIVGAMLAAAQTLWSGTLGPGLVVLGVAGLLVWQAVSLFKRNRPRTYTPDAIPEDVMPKGQR